MPPGRSKARWWTGSTSRSATVPQVLPGRRHAHVPGRGCVPEVDDDQPAVGVGRRAFPGPGQDLRPAVVAGPAGSLAQLPSSGPEGRLRHDPQERPVPELQVDVRRARPGHGQGRPAAAPAGPRAARRAAAGPPAGSVPPRPRRDPCPPGTPWRRVARRGSRRSGPGPAGRRGPRRGAGARTPRRRAPAGRRGACRSSESNPSCWSRHSRSQ